MEIDNKVLRMIPMDTTNNQKQREKNTLWDFLVSSFFFSCVFYHMIGKE